MKMQRAIEPSSAFLPTTLEGLDKILHGGIACGSLTEVKDPCTVKRICFCFYHRKLKKCYNFVYCKKSQNIYKFLTVKQSALIYKIVIDLF